MYEVSAHAVRHKDSVEVTIFGFLPTSCHQARIADVYPGGHIVYIKDPGSAQVFIEETVLPGTIYCAMVLIPWAATTTIIDSNHSSVSIYINKKKNLEVAIEEKSKGQFIVLQLTGGIIPNGPYSIVPAGSFYPAIFTQVYGPASYAKCDQWIKEHTDLSFAILDGVALGYGDQSDNAKTKAEGGGGGGLPHGLKAFISGAGPGNPRGL